jgi:hypothetical protein
MNRYPLYWICSTSKDKMKKYYAVVRFETLEFEAEDDAQAEDKINEMLDQLGEVETVVGWDNPDWTIYTESD